MPCLLQQETAAQHPQMCLQVWTLGRGTESVAEGAEGAGSRPLATEVSCEDCKSPAWTLMSPAMLCVRMPLHWSLLPPLMTPANSPMSHSGAQNMATLLHASGSPHPSGQTDPQKLIKELAWALAARVGRMSHFQTLNGSFIKDLLKYY